MEERFTILIYICSAFATDQVGEFALTLFLTVTYKLVAALRLQKARQTFLDDSEYWVPKEHSKRIA
jgi:hypothetical protein